MPSIFKLSSGLVFNYLSARINFQMLCHWIFNGHAYCMAGGRRGFSDSLSRFQIAFRNFVGNPFCGHENEWVGGYPEDTRIPSFPFGLGLVQIKFIALEACIDIHLYSCVRVLGTQHAHAGNILMFTLVIEIVLQSHIKTTQRVVPTTETPSSSSSSSSSNHLHPPNHPFAGRMPNIFRPYRWCCWQCAIVAAVAAAIVAAVAAGKFLALHGRLPLPAFWRRAVAFN